MPPYPHGVKPKPQRSKPSFKVTILACNWCKAPGAQLCPACDKPSCRWCITSMEGGRCTHKTYKPVQNTGWGTSCPNAPCTSDCTQCNGRGVIW